MSLVVLEDVGLDFGARSIFDGASFRISATDRIGLVGPNGSGKTTLLRMIAREQQPDRGALRESRHLRLGYLPQELNVESGRSLIGLVLSSVPGRDQLTSDIATCEAELSNPKAREDTLIELGERVAEVEVGVDAGQEGHGLLVAQMLGRQGLEHVAQDVLRDGIAGRVHHVACGLLEHAVQHCKEGVARGGVAVDDHLVHVAADGLGHHLHDGLAQLAALDAEFADPDFYEKHKDDWEEMEANQKAIREEVARLYTRWEELGAILAAYEESRK